MLSTATCKHGRKTHRREDFRLLPVQGAVEHGVEVEYAGAVGREPMTADLQRLFACASCAKCSHRKHPHGLLQSHETATLVAMDERCIDSVEMEPSCLASSRTAEVA